MWWEKLKENWHPEDKLCFPDSKRERYYRTKYQVAKDLQPKSICEIGVRAGYSGFAFLSAVPDAEYIGIDLNKGTDGGVVDYYKHALKLFSIGEFNSYTIELKDSQEINDLGRKYDLIHIDGDHSFDGCLHDIILASRHAKYILVDDYDYITNVRIACCAFRNDNPQNKYTYIPDNYHGNLLIEIME